MGQYDRLIDTLATHPGDRVALRALAAGMADHPLLAGRAEAVLRELARPAVRSDGTEYTAEECLEYASDFMGAIGIPADLAFPTLSAIGDATLDDVPTEAIEDQGLVDHVEASMRSDPDAYFRSADAQREYGQSLERLHAPRPAAQPGEVDDPAYRAAVRASDAQRRGEIEAMMRDDEGRRYWSDQAVQREYNEILQRQTAPPPMPAAAPTPAEPTTGDDNQPVAMHELPGYVSWSADEGTEP